MRVGCDLISIEKIEKIHNKHAESFLNKFLSPKEQILVKNPATLAGFWAAKEAASKALGVGISKHCGFLDIKISKSKKNAPKLKFSKKTMRKFHIKKAKLSITHDKGLAMAVVIIK
ncbi:holo-ACP synthase [Campylobacter helveticus]|uniref:Holo-[acyl-carrier-protein] synthase n=1 Tax=Campylobacter helveticus TaxID=28898 RepID=A0ABY3L2Q3_9BACT|nr:holo-ACP synthase [Campylobacter helveticus]MCR2038566.1 holo-ACP synthase [Campylobacter helveticus]MCR2063431.1 holo-ACP synthase [Campylobacter helveticus]TNH34710.1 holo-ACP synthase [Campylobacter helveticus]TNH36873.1 holo-ACP synthase [Campylobacter helveticus]TXK58360.1 holo-ACP synthase [Campylobacter helveticus]